MDSQMMADTRWRVSQAYTSQLLELLWQIWDILNRKLRFSDGPIWCGVVTSASGARTNAVFTVIRSTKKSDILVTDHISGSSMTMRMNTCES